MDFTEQVALVTGGSRGIGREVVRLLSQRGAHVQFCYLRRTAAAYETLMLCRGSRGEVRARQTDVRDAAAVERLVTETLTRWGRLDILINCAGIAAYAPVEQVSTSQWHAILATNLMGVYHTCRAALRPMVKQRYGRIVNVAGKHAVCGFPHQADYAAALGGVLGMTRALAREFAPRHITVNAVAPGFIQTELLDVVPHEDVVWTEQIVALRRVGQPHEAAAAAVFLASPLASYITGQTLPVDGGWTTA